MRAHAHAPFRQTTECWRRGWWAASRTAGPTPGATWTCTAAWKDAAVAELKGDGGKQILHRFMPAGMTTTFPPGGGIGGFSLIPAIVDTVRTVLLAPRPAVQSLLDELVLAPMTTS
jgi:hypothetical protein